MKESNLIKLQSILYITFGLVPIVAGADKFFNLLTEWEKYIHPTLLDILPMEASSFMHIVGIIEIIAGILVLYKTTPGAYIVSAWLVLISLNLIGSGDYLDVAVRDLVMAISAYTLAKLTEITSKSASTQINH